MTPPVESLAAALSAIGRALDEATAALEHAWNAARDFHQEIERDRTRRPHEVPAGKRRRPYGRNR